MGWVPEVDLGGEPSAVVAAIAEACERVGFLSVTNHGVPEEVLRDVWREAWAFFDLPPGDKQTVAMPRPGYPYGYGQLAYETLSRSLGNAAPPDLKETFVIGPLDHPVHVVDDPDEASVWSPNLWPDAQPSLRPSWERAYRELASLSARLLSYVAVGLHLPADHFEPLIDRHTSAMRANSYPPMDRVLPGQLRAGAHTDYGTLTVLLSDPEEGGLEVLHPNGEWTPVPPRPGALVINLGDAMQRWTNDRYRSTLHRVVVTPGRRQSIAFFHNANWDAAIECLPTCLGPGEQPRHAPIAAGPHLMAKFRSTVLPAAVD